MDANVNIFILSKDSDYRELETNDLTPLRFGMFYNKHQFVYYAHCVYGKDNKKKRVWNNVYFPRIINWLHKRETLKAEGVRPSEVIFLPTYNAYTSTNIRPDWKHRLQAHYVALMKYYSTHETGVNKNLIMQLTRKIYEPLLIQSDLLQSVNLFLGFISGELHGKETGWILPTFRKC